MITNRSISTAILFAVLVAAGLITAPALAQDGNAQFEVSGTSTVRGWTCPVDGALEVTPGQASDPLPGFPNGVNAATVTVQVSEFECPEEEMNEHLQDAMESAEYPEIVFELQEYTLEGETAQASGSITIHGETKPLSLEIQLVESPEGIRGVGETEINMTDFGVTPPSVFLGLLNVGEVVTISFDAPLPAAE